MPIEQEQTVSAGVSVPIARWMLEHRSLEDPEDEVTTLGADPLPEKELDSLLAGVGAFSVSAHTDFLIVGREGWKPHMH